MTEREPKCPYCKYRTTAASLQAHVAMAHAEQPDPMPTPALVPTFHQRVEASLVEDGLVPFKYPTREAWMLAAVDLMRPIFAEIGEEIPPVRISMGWPGGRGNKQHVVGQCWGAATVADGIPAVFVSPAQKDVLEILGTIMHEDIHAAGHFQHRAKFTRVAKLLDPEGDHSGSWAKSWPSPGRSPVLFTRLSALADQLGPFPHSVVNALGGLLGITKGPAVQGTRMLKVWCGECGYTLRATAKWLHVATPVCPNEDCGMVGLAMEVEWKD